MLSSVAIPTEMNRTATQFAQDIPYSTFKQAAYALHEQGKEGAKEGDFQVLTRGMQLLSELGVLFPSYAAQLADDPEFLS
jgi:hypothetical protein